MLVAGTTLTAQGVVPSPVGRMPAAHAATNTVVSIEFDDGYPSQFQTNAMLLAHGMRGTYYINSGETWGMSWSQIHQLADAGHEIGGHSLNHPDLTSLSTAEATSQVCDDRNNLIAQGFNAISFAYPFGRNNATVRQIVENCGYTTGRGVTGGTETIPPQSPFLTRTPENVNQDLTLSDVQGFVTQAENSGGGWVQLVFHDICSPGGSCDFYSMPPATFNALLDWLQPRAANGTVVKTVAEVMGGATPSATATLSVSKSGSGTGTVTSAPTGINCGSTCTASYDNGTSVTLTAAAASGSTFTGWSGGGCSGTGTCTVTLTGNTAVSATFTAAPSGPYAPGVLSDAPAGYWRLGEASGTSAADSAANNTGTYAGATLNAASLLATDTGNRAAGFNGTNQYVRVPSSTALSPSAHVSVEAWIRPTSVPTSGFRSVASKAEAYSLQFNAGRLEFTIIQGATRRRLQAPAGAIVANTTYHVVGTYDGTMQRLYINGVQRATAALTGAINVNANNLTIGSWNGSQEFFAGTIDEVAVYPSVLAADRAAAHFAAGSVGAPPAQVQLTLSKSGSGTGTVMSSPAGISCGAACSASFADGTSVTLTATAGPGSTFAGWSGGGCSGTGTCVVSLSSATSVDAAFALIPTFQLTVSRSGAGSGSVSSSPAGISCGAACSASFADGTSVTLTATAGSGSTFAGWSGGGCSGTGTCVVTVTSATTVTADFGVIPTSLLTVSKGGTGSGSVSSSPAGISCGAACSASFADGTSVTLTATAGSGSTFAGWSGGGCSGTGTCVVTVTSATTVTADFGVAPISSYEQTVVGDAPGGYWRLNETSGSTAVKTAGGANNGTYTNVTLGAAGLLTGVGNTAASFSGNSSRIQIASNSAVSPSTRVSVEAWIKPTALPTNSNDYSIVAKAQSYGLQFNGSRLEFWIQQSNRTRTLVAPAGAVAVGGTYHIVGVFDGATQRIYVNGAEVAVRTQSGTIRTTNNALFIGSYNGSSEFFRGTIDEVAVYSTALTASQVANHRIAGTTP